MLFLYRKLIQFSLFVSLLFTLSILGCKKQTETPDPVIPVEEEVVPGQTVGFGAVPLEPAAYLKLKLIQEPQVPNGRTLKDSKLPQQYDLSNHMPPVQSQGKQGSCTSWSVAYATRSYYNGLANGVKLTLADGKVNNDAVFSPAFVYNQVKVNDCLDGSSISASLDLLRTAGVCTWNDMPYNPASCSDQPSQPQAQKASQYKIKDWGRVALNVNSIRKFVYYDTPIIICGRLNEAFKKYKSSTDTDGQFIWKDGSNIQTSYHAMVIIGYDDSRKAFKVQNSWGKNWGNSGYIWLAYDIVPDVVREAYIMVPEQWPASTQAPKVLTDGVGNVANGQIELKGRFTTLGNLAIIRYGLCVSNTAADPVDKIEVVNSPLNSEDQTFSVKAPAVGPKLKYRAFAETLQGISYGEILTVDVNNGSADELKEPLLFADARSVFNPLTGDVVAEMPEDLGGRFGLSDHNGIALTKTHYYVIGETSLASHSVMAYGIVDHKLKWTYDTGTLTEGYVATAEKFVYVCTNKSIIGINRQTGAKAWEYSAPSRFSGQPVVAGGAVYFGVVDKGITAVNAETGTLIREYPKRCGRNTATVVDGVLYYITSTGVVAYNTATGSELWDYNGAGYFLNMTDRRSKVIFADGKLIVTGFSSGSGPTKGKLLALDAATGKVAWEQVPESVLWQANISYDSGTLCYLTDTKDNQVKLVTLESATGNLRWERKMPVNIGVKSIDFNVLVAGTNILLLGYDDNSPLKSLDSRTGAVRWKKAYAEANALLKPSLITKEGKVYQLCTMGGSN
jgi:outer membrane protein assembly factor BamB/C1A family cysteine protease